MEKHYCCIAMRIESYKNHFKEKFQIAKAELSHELHRQLTGTDIIWLQESMEVKDIKQYLLKTGKEPSYDNIESIYKLLEKMELSWDRFELLASRADYTDEQIHKALLKVTETVEVTLLAPDRKLLHKMKTLYPRMHCWNSSYIPKKYEVQYAITGSDVVFVVGEQPRSVLVTMHQFCETWHMSLFPIRKMIHLSDEQALEAYQRRMVANMIRTGMIDDMPLEGINKEIADFTKNLDMETEGKEQSEL